MLALAYLVVVIAAGDALARRWFRYVSWSHRIATAILVGLPIGAFASYLVALALQDLDDSLLVADAIVAIALVGLVVLLRRRRQAAPAAVMSSTSGWDRMTILTILVISAWLMFSTYSFDDGTLGMAVGIWSDFGPTTAIAQSFAVGDNFPTEYPHFAHESIRYHFMYYFQVGNLTHLGLDPSLANNLMSVATLVSMLVLVMALGRRLFRSAVIGRIGALLFFFHGSLSFIPLVATYATPGAALEGLWNLAPFVSSGFPYRGEEWGIWTQMVFLNQRHLASAIGLILVIVLFLLDRLRRRTDAGPRDATSAVDAQPEDRVPEAGAVAQRDVLASVRRALRDPWLPGYLFAGFLAGLLPIWNGAIYVAAGAVLAMWLLWFPNRFQMLALAAVAAIVSLPQILFIQPGNLGGEMVLPRFHWGYIIEGAGPLEVATYLAFIFGPKLALTTVALVRARWRQWGVFLSFTSLLGVAFFIQLSVEVLANHKFINTWLIVLNLFAAAGVVALWRLRGVVRIPARAIAGGVLAVILVGGTIDFMPIKNQGVLTFPMNGDRLFEWVRTQTDPDDVFLTDLYIVHPILLAGRSIFYGWSYYAWSAGYNVAPREREYRELLTTRSPRELVRRLQANDIAYVAIDDGLRSQAMVGELNEDLFREHLEIVFDDADNRYANLVVFRVPDDPAAWQALPDASPVDAFRGGHGSAPGRFDGPRGIGLSPDGLIAVADTRNHRVQLFEPDGSFRAGYGETGVAGSSSGQFNEPGGVALDAAGHVYVADTLNHRLVELDAAGGVVDVWTGPEPGFYGPRDVTVGPDGDIYVLDQGRARVVRRATDGAVTTYGSFGTGDGQLNDPTGLAVHATRLYVADTGNARIVVFELSGEFVTALTVDEWRAPLILPDVAIDDAEELVVYASSPATGEILAFSPDEGMLRGVVSEVELGRPGSLAVASDGSLLVVDETGNRIVLIEPALLGGLHQVFRYVEQRVIAHLSDDRV